MHIALPQHRLVAWGMVSGCWQLLLDCLTTRCGLQANTTAAKSLITASFHLRAQPSASSPY